MRTLKLILPAVVLLAVVAAACGESAERKAAKDLARRNSCVAAELALTAKERVARLDTQVVVTQGGPFERITVAGREFAASYKTFADAFSRSADYADSAAFARSRADSLRFARMADSVRPVVSPAAGMERNSAVRFTEDMRVALSNPDHPCNQPKDPDEGS
jgi:fructoselysine-6-P-deglycase FrlB-like protein